MSIYLMSRFFKMNMGGCNRKLVAVRLADFADDDGRGIYPGVPRLVAETELSERTVQRILADFEAEGLLVCRQRATGRRGMANHYDFDMAAIARIEAGKATGDSVTPVATGVTEAATGVTGDADGCQGDTLTVIEPPRNPSLEREGARARDDDRDGNGRETGMAETEAEAESPKAVKRAFRHWFAAYPTASADGHGPAWREWQKLTAEDREKARTRLKGWIATVKASGRTKFPAASTYLADRKFDFVDEGAARAAERRLDRVAARPFGPVWGGMRALACGNGPQPFEMPGDLFAEAENIHAGLLRANEARAAAWRERKGIGLGADGRLVFPADFERAERQRRQTSDGYPLVNRLNSLAREARAEMVDGRNGLLAELCEPVPVGSAVYEAWRTCHERMGWPLWPDPGKMEVVYFPKGGPEGMDGFLRAARAAMSDGGRDAEAA